MFSKLMSLIRVYVDLLARHTGRTFKRSFTVYKEEGITGIVLRFKWLFRIAVEGHFLYQVWIRHYDTARVDLLLEKMKEFSRLPVISIIMPVYNTQAYLLEEAILSVKRQLYPHWELCIADDASEIDSVRDILCRHAAGDSRIKIVFRESNGHISEASNSALAIATGDYVAFLDHDDSLAEHALFYVVDAINRFPDSEIIYSDEDRIDINGHRHSPYFKSDWNYDLFLSHNLITHLGVYKRTLVSSVSGFRSQYDGAQDYDLALRCIEKIDHSQIHHIPRILYHWRIVPGSTAFKVSEKPYAMTAGAMAIRDHLNRCCIPADVEILPTNNYRVRYSTGGVSPLVSLIIPTRNGGNILKKCINSIIQYTEYPDYEIIIVDNGSDDAETILALEDFSKKTLIRVIHDSREFNFSAINNSAVAFARGSYLCLLNDDIEVISTDWLQEMVSHAMRPGIGAVGARLWYPHNTLQHGGIILGIGGFAGHAHRHMPKGNTGYFCRAVLTQNFSAVTGACLVVSKSIYESVGGMDEQLTVALNDVEFCIRVMRSGYRNLWTPFAELMHRESVTRGYEDTPEKVARLKREVEYLRQKWGDAIDNDFAYSPNLTLAKEDFSFAWPPRVELFKEKRFELKGCRRPN